MPLDLFDDAKLAKRARALNAYYAGASGVCLSVFRDICSRVTLKRALEIAIVINREAAPFPGIYALWSGCDDQAHVTYVGQSRKSIESRIDSHSKDKDFWGVSCVYFKGEEEIAYLDSWEAYIIFSLVPPLNRSLPGQVYREIKRFPGSKELNKRFTIEASLIAGKIYIQIPEEHGF